jgi:hypothetical protein
LPRRRDGFTNCQHSQQPPEISAVCQPRKLPAPRTVAETRKRAQRNVFFVKRPAGIARQLGTSQPQQTAKIAIPEPLDVTGVSRLHSFNPARDGIVIRHDQTPLSSGNIINNRYRMIAEHAKTGQNPHGFVLPIVPSAIFR